jgi:hypothetical protein
MFIDVLSPFRDPVAYEMVQSLLMMPLFAAKPAYLEEVKRTFLPAAVTCEGIQCTRCQSPILRITPMEFDEVSTECCEAAEAAEAAKTTEDYFEDYLDEEVDADALDAYIDEVLDNDYDY